MTVTQGEVWWGPAPQKASPAYRPWLVVSETSHPFASEECITVALTTQNHSASIPVPDTAWIRGGSQKDAFVSPWYVTTIKHRDFDSQQGTLSKSLVAAVIDALHRYTPAPDR
jgi:PemK-like protein.